MRIWFVLILAVFLNLFYALPSKDEFQVIFHNPLLSYQSRLRLKLGSPFYEYIIFLKANIPENSTVAIPPETEEWGMYGNFLYMQNWLFPRSLTTDLSKADYAIVVDYWPKDANAINYLPSENLGFTKLSHD